MGVFAQKNFKKGEPLMFYVGELLTTDEGRKRERKYTEKDGSFVYFFTHNGSNWCIDATKPDGRLGRLINDSDSPNCVMKKVMVYSLPHLCLFALRDIVSGTELRYDYGVKDLPWRKKHQKITQGNGNVAEVRSSSPVFPYAAKTTKSMNKKKICKRNIESIMERIAESDNEDFENDQLPCLRKEESFEILGRDITDISSEKISDTDDICIIEPSDGTAVAITHISDQAEIIKPSTSRMDWKPVVSKRANIVQPSANRMAKKPRLVKDIDLVYPSTSQRTSESVKKVPVDQRPVSQHVDIIKPILKEIRDLVEMKDVCESNMETVETSTHDHQGDISNVSNESILDDSGIKGDFPEFSETDDDDEKEQHSDSDDSGSDYQPDNGNTSETDVETDVENDCENDGENDGGGDDDDWKKPLGANDQKAASKRPDHKTEDKDIRESKDDTSISMENSSSVSKSKCVITVPTMKYTEHGQRIYDKTHACLFCGVNTPKIARHCQSVHKNENEMMKIAAIETRTDEGKERKRLELDILRFKGDFAHNIKVLKNGGELKVWRRPSEKETVDYQVFTPCTFCLAFVQKHELWRHVASCPLNEKRKQAGCSPDETSYHRKLRQESQMLLFSSTDRPAACSERFMADVVSSMVADKVSFIAKKDSLILAYGSFVYTSKGKSKTAGVSQKMRMLARLMNEVYNSSCDESKSLCEYLNPESFDKIVDATKILCGLTNDSSPDELPHFKTPSLALKIGYALKQCAVLHRGHALRARDLTTLDALKYFIELIESEWSNQISSIALKTLDDGKFKAPAVVPLTSDLLILRNHLLKEIGSAIQSLTKEASLDKWRMLCEATASRIIIFNKRRANEPTKLLIKDFVDRPKWENTRIEEVKQSLPPLEQELCKRLDLVYVKGKRGNKCPILLTKDTKQAIEVLIAKRDAVGVNRENQFIFAAPTRGSLKFLRGNDCIAATLKRCNGLKSPDGIKSTKLRKFVATVSQIVDLKENELGWLAKHMGHDINVHRQYYRLHESTLELAKVSKLLLAVDDGRAGQFSGKKLDEITVEDLPEEIDETGRDEIDDQQEDQSEGEIEEARKKRAPRKQQKHRSWKRDEIYAVLNCFEAMLKKHKLPGKRQIEECKRKNQEALKDRSWLNIKYYCKQHVEKLKRSS